MVTPGQFLISGQASITFIKSATLEPHTARIIIQRSGMVRCSGGSTKNKPALRPLQPPQRLSVTIYTTNRASSSLRRGGGAHSIHGPVGLLVKAGEASEIQR